MDKSLVESVESFAGFQSTKIMFSVEKANVRPIIAFQVIPFFVPDDLNENKCILIDDILDEARDKYQTGKASAKESIVSGTSRNNKFSKATSIFNDPDEEDRSKAGLAFSEVKGGTFKYSCQPNADPKPLDIPRGKAILLNRACCIKFEPAKDRIWGNGEVSFKAFGWDGSDDKAAESEISLEEIKTSNAFSVNQMTGMIPRENCEGVLGRPCPKKKCPEGSEERKSIRIFHCGFFYVELWPIRRCV